MRNDLFNFRINKELKEYIQERANEQNIPMARYLKNLIKKDMNDALETQNERLRKNG